MAKRQRSSASQSHSDRQGDLGSVRTQFPWSVASSETSRGAGLAAEIRERTNDGSELIDFILDLMRNEALDVRVRANAATWLCDRGWGKPSIMVEKASNDEVGSGGDEVSDALMAKLDEMAERNSHDRPSYEG